MQHLRTSGRKNTQILRAGRRGKGWGGVEIRELSHKVAEAAPEIERGWSSLAQKLWRDLSVYKTLVGAGTKAQRQRVSCGNDFTGERSICI